MKSVMLMGYTEKKMLPFSPTQNCRADSKQEKNETNIKYHVRVKH